MMKLRIATLVLPLALTCSMALADDSNMNNNASNSSMASPSVTTTNSALLSSVLQELQASGYTSIKKIELDDGIYQIDTFDPSGDEITLRVNPKTGVILNKPDELKTITMQQAAANIEKAGYMKIKSIECDDDYYEVDALDKNGDDVDLKVNRKTGVVSDD